MRVANVVAGPIHAGERGEQGTRNGQTTNCFEDELKHGGLLCGLEPIQEPLTPALSQRERENLDRLLVLWGQRHSIPTHKFSPPIQIARAVTPRKYSDYEHGCDAGDRGEEKGSEQKEQRGETISDG
jgi:hypothetical protein